MLVEVFMLFLFVLTMMIVIGAVPVMIISLGSKSSKNFARTGSGDKVFQLERRIEQLEKELNNSVRKRIENIETIITEDEYKNNSSEELSGSTQIGDFTERLLDRPHKDTHQPSDPSDI